MRYIPAIAEAPWTRLVPTTSFPAAATVEITDISQSFTNLKLTVIGASNATTTRYMLVQADSDNGASYDATVGNYIYLSDENAGGGVAGSVASFGPTGAGSTIANTVSYDFVLTIYGYRTSRPTFILIGYWDAVRTLFNSGMYIGGTPINALKLFWNNTGNFDAGTYMLEAQ